jgi:hypothetical protein
MIKTWKWHVILLAILVVEMVPWLQSPAVPAEVRHPRHTGFDCVLPINDRWISCARFPHLEARA